MRELSRALLLINKDAQFVLRGKEIEWHGPGDKPNDIEIADALTQIKNQNNSSNTRVEIELLPYSIDNVISLLPILYREMTPSGVVLNHEGDKIAGFADEELSNDFIIGALVNSIKELKKMIDDQAIEIDTLKKQENRVIVISK